MTPSVCPQGWPTLKWIFSLYSAPSCRVKLFSFRVLRSPADTHTHRGKEDNVRTSLTVNMTHTHTRHQRSWFSQQARAFVGDDDVSENESLWNHTAADWVTRRNVAFSSWCHPSIRCLYGADCYTSTNQKQSAHAEIAPIHLQTPRSFIFNLTFKAVKLGNFRSTVYFPPLRLNCRWEEM